MIFCKNKRSPGFILIFTLFSLALLSMIFVYCLEDRGPREKFYSLALKAGGFLDVKKNGNTLEVDVRGLLDLERWSMLNYLRACFYNLATDPVSYKWYTEDNGNYGAWALKPFILNSTGNNSFSIKENSYKFGKDRYHVVAIINPFGFVKIKDFVDSLFGGPLSIKYSDAVKKSKRVNDGDIVHNSNLKVEAKIGLADNKLPFNEKFKKEALNALYECIKTAYSTDLIGKNKDPGPWKIDGITYSNNGAVEITNKVGGLIDDYNKKCSGYTLTFSDLMSIDELRLLIQGNFEDYFLDEHKWAKQGFNEKNAKELEALIRDTFVFHDIYAVNFLLANKFVQDAFIKVNIPTEFSSNSPMPGDRYKTVDYRLRNVGRNVPDETDTTGKYIVKDTADSMYSFNGIESLIEEDLVEFLKQEFYDDYMNVLKPKLKTEIPVSATTLSGLSDIELANLYKTTFKGNPSSVSRDQAQEEIKERTRNAIRKLLKLVLEGRYKLYYGGNGHGDASNVIKYDHKNGFLKDQKQFSEAFDYLALEGETGRLASLSDRELKLVRGRENDEKNGIINMAIDEDDGIMNLQILKILCKKLSVFCAKDEKDKKLYLFPYPWDDRLSDEWNEKNKLPNHDVGSICDISNNGVEHTTYYYDYLDDKGKPYDSKSRLEYEFDEKIGVMKPILSMHAEVDKDHNHKHSLLLKEDVFTDGELMEKGYEIDEDEKYEKNPWDRVRNFCSFSNYANVKLRIYDDSLKFIRKETDDVICFDVPNDLKLQRFTENSGGSYSHKNGKIFFKPNGGFHIEPMNKGGLDSKD